MVQKLSITHRTPKSRAGGIDTPGLQLFGYGDLGWLPLPADAVRVGASVRAQDSGDAAFLETLYASVRWEELAPTGWTDSQKRLFLRQQFELQPRQYAAGYPRGCFAVIECNGEPAGRICLNATTGDIRIIDISLSPAHRGVGIGSVVLGAILAAAGALGKTASLSVVLENPARRLYQRLGFRDDGPPNGPYQPMRWRPESAPAGPGARSNC